MMSHIVIVDIVVRGFPSIRVDSKINAGTFLGVALKHPQYKSNRWALISLMSHPASLSIDSSFLRIQQTSDR